LVLVLVLDSALVSVLVSVSVSFLTFRFYRDTARKLAERLKALNAAPKAGQGQAGATATQQQSGQKGKGKASGAVDLKEMLEVRKASDGREGRLVVVF
jgi:hypothetical protein